jgi:hypothetical protein
MNTFRWLALSALVVSGCQTESKPAEKPLVSLSKASYDVAEAVSVAYGAPIKPASGEKHWVTLAASGTPDNEWGKWHYVDAGATTDTLQPEKPGSYEVRLHDGYPRLPFHVIARVPVTITGTAAVASTAPTASAAATVAAGPVSAVAINRLAFKKGEPISVTFTPPIAPPSGEQYWLTLAPAGTPDSEWGKWHIVKDGATNDTLSTEASGSFEVRLHDGYPRLKSHVVSRHKVTVH